jgi:hypothetical protein
MKHPKRDGGKDKLPDPWLFDSEALLRELARCRETALQIPITNPNATHFGIQLTVSSLWTLEENVRYLLRLHRERQRAWAKRSGYAARGSGTRTRRKKEARIIHFAA